MPHKIFNENLMKCLKEGGECFETPLLALVSQKGAAVSIYIPMNIINEESGSRLRLIITKRGRN